jgi:hypothetical protein
MKKIAFVIVAILLASIATYGQQLSFGIKPSFLILTGKYIETPKIMGLDLNPRSSYGVGFTMNDQLSKLFGVQIEPRYIVKGYNINQGASENDIYRNNYISIPALLYFSPIHNFNLELGPEVSYLINSKIKYSNTGSFLDITSPNQKHFELSIITGIGYAFLKRFDFGIRYGIALTPCESGEINISDGPPDLHVTYKFYNRYFEFYMNSRIFQMLTK